MFWLKWKDVNQRSDFINYMREKKISCVFHYVPLHSSYGGNKYGRMDQDRYTTMESERLVRLPMFYALKKEELEYMLGVITEFIHML
jgi:dTDP-4-amino-4,6-dideoxygalactose transaminase